MAIETFFNMFRQTSSTNGAADSTAARARMGGSPLVLWGAPVNGGRGIVLYAQRLLLHALSTPPSTSAEKLNMLDDAMTQLKRGPDAHRWIIMELRHHRIRLLASFSHLQFSRERALCSLT